MEGHPMTTTSSQYTTRDVSRPDNRRTVRLATETKAGPKTTEFMLAVVFVVAVIIAAYLDNDDSFSRQDGWWFGAIVVAAYLISRGLAKLGVHERYTDEIDIR
jgi:hypothetical protein